jgi:hypothetical protein
VQVAPDISAEKLSAFYQRQPLALVRRDIAQLYGYRWAWRPSKVKPPGNWYLSRDERTRSWERQLRQESRDVLRSRQVQLLAKAKRLLQTKPEDAASLPADEQDLLAYIDGFRAGFDVLCSLTPQEQARLIDTGNVSMDRAIPHSVQTRVLDMLRRTAPDSSELKGKLEFDLASSGSATEYSPGQSDWYWLRVRDEDGRFLAQGLALTPEAAHGQPPLPCAELTQKSAKTLPSDGRALAADPRLQTIVPFGGKPYDFEEALALIAATTKLSIVSDYYTTPQPKVVLHDQTGYNAVAWLCKIYSHVFAFREGRLLVRDSEWPRRMAHEVPLAVLDGIKASGDLGTLNYEQSLAAATLNRDQLLNLPLHRYRVGWDADSEAHLWLRLAAGLRPAERLRLESPAGLSVRDLGQGGKAALRALWVERWQVHGYSPEVLTLRLERPKTEADGTNAVVTFAIRLQGAKKDSRLLIPVSPSQKSEGPAPRQAGGKQ